MTCCRGVVLAAVEQDGYALRYAAKPLRADKELVLAAAGNNQTLSLWYPFKHCMFAPEFQWQSTGVSDKSYRGVHARETPVPGAPGVRYGADRGGAADRVICDAHRRYQAGDKECMEPVVKPQVVGTIQYVEWPILIDRVHSSCIADV